MAELNALICVQLSHTNFIRELAQESQQPQASSWKMPTLQVKLDLLEEFWKKVETAHFEILQLLGDDQKEDYLTKRVYDKTLRHYAQGRTALASLMFATVNVASSSQPSAPSQPTVQSAQAERSEERISKEMDKLLSTKPMKTGSAEGAVSVAPLAVVSVVSDSSSTHSRGSSRGRGRLTSVAEPKQISSRGEGAYPCSMCTEDHFIVSCPEFRHLSPEARKELVVAKFLCFQCLGKHRVALCKCSQRCKKCNGSHHTMIHCDISSAAIRAALSKADSQHHLE